MIIRLSNYIVHNILKDSISDDDKELYSYGLFILLSHLFFTAIVILIGLVFNCIFESIVFFCSFHPIRKYAGGYHAKTETRCEICSLLLMFFSIMVIRLSCYYNLQILLFCSLIATIVIFFIAPLDTPEKPLSEKEFIFFKKKTRISLIIILLITLVSYGFEQNVLYVPCCVSIIAESILIIAGKIKKVKTKAEKQMS